MAAERPGGVAGGVVLVVDDESAVRGLVKAILSGAGFQVLAVQTGADALAHVSSFVVDVALVDLKLANEDGAQVIEQLRKLRPQMRIVAMSGEIDDAGEPVLAGADALLAKPFTIQRLLAAVNL